MRVGRQRDAANLGQQRGEGVVGKLPQQPAALRDRHRVGRVGVDQVDLGVGPQLRIVQDHGGDRADLVQQPLPLRRVAGPQELGPDTGRGRSVRTVDSAVGHLARSTMIHIFWTTSFPSDHFDLRIEATACQHPVQRCATNGQE